MCYICLLPNVLINISGTPGRELDFLQVKNYIKYAFLYLFGDSNQLFQCNILTGKINK